MPRPQPGLVSAEGRSAICLKWINDYLDFVFGTVMGFVCVCTGVDIVVYVLLGGKDGARLGSGV